MRSRFAIIGRSSPERQYVTQRPAAGVSLTFINPASSMVFGYDQLRVVALIEPPPATGMISAVAHAFTYGTSAQVCSGECP
jgi:hypothetical protein